MFHPVVAVIFFSKSGSAGDLNLFPKLRDRRKKMVHLYHRSKRLHADFEGYTLKSCTRVLHAHPKA